MGQTEALKAIMCGSEIAMGLGIIFPKASLATNQQNFKVLTIFKTQRVKLGLNKCSHL